VIVGVFVGLVFGVAISAVVYRSPARSRRRECFHHDPDTGESFVGQALIDLGRRKHWWCRRCGRDWFT